MTPYCKRISINVKAYCFTLVLLSNICAPKTDKNYGISYWDLNMDKIALSRAYLLSGFTMLIVPFKKPLRKSSSSIYLKNYSSFILIGRHLRKTWATLGCFSFKILGRFL